MYILLWLYIYYLFGYFNFKIVYIDVWNRGMIFFENFRKILILLYKLRICRFEVEFLLSDIFKFLNYVGYIN